MTANRTYIGMEHAKTVLLHETRTLKKDADFDECELLHDASGALYHIVFHANGMEYECYVDALTAQVRGLLSQPQEETSLCAEVCA